MNKTRIIANSTLHINDLKSTFTAKEIISVNDLVEFYKNYESDVKRSTIDWRIFELNQQGILFRIGRGKYSLSETTIFEPDISRSMKNLYGTVRNQFPFINSCIWSTKWINEFMLHQPGRFYTILEVEKDAMESVFYALKEQGKDVFLDPNQEIINNYLIDSKEPIIITKLTTEAPILELDNINTISLEKMLVDIYCDEKLFSAFQGAELLRIYKTAFEKYTISSSKILRYANRRNKKVEIEKLINNITKERQ